MRNENKTDTAIYLSKRRYCYLEPGKRLALYGTEYAIYFWLESVQGEVAVYSKVRRHAGGIEVTAAGGIPRCLVKLRIEPFYSDICRRK